MKPKYLHAAIVILSLLVVGTQPALGTKLIPGDLSIGTWDDLNRIYTLTTDVSETIQINEDNLTLDGDGYTVTAAPSLTGIYVPVRTGVTVRNLNVQGCYIGIYVYSGSGNTLTNTTTSDNYNGIHSDHSNNINVTNNTASANGVGIWLHNSNNGVVTANTALDNYGGGIYLYLSDVDGDGFVDLPYIFDGGQDNLPLVPTPEQAVDVLTGIVEDMELQPGLETSLTNKLDAVKDALAAANAGVREDAVNKLEAFINAVEAQRGNKLTDAEADELVTYADWIIATLSEP